MKTRKNKFRQIAIILTAAVLLLLSVFYGYLSWRKHDAYKGSVHADAAFILKVNADQLYGTLVMDGLGSPFYYLKKGKQSIESGLSIPAQIFIYTLKSKSAQTYFCALPVEDQQQLKSFLSQKMGIVAFSKMGQYTRGISRDGRLIVAFNTHTFAAGYALNKENVDDVLADLLNRKNLMPEQDPKLSKLKALDQHLAYVFNEVTGTGEFKDGLIHMEGDFNFDGLQVKGKTFHHRIFEKDVMVKMWLNAWPALNKSYGEIQVKDHTIYPDSLLKYCAGYFDLELGSPVSQIDTVVTYEYNDDFEKEETLTPRTVKVPGVNGLVSGNAVGLMNYLHQAGLVQRTVVNKNVFPLYQVYTQPEGSYLAWSTAKKQVVATSKSVTPYFFYLEADLARLKVQFPLLEKYIGQASRLVIKARPGSLDKYHFDIDLHFKRKDINAFRQLR